MQNKFLFSNLNHFLPVSINIAFLWLVYSHSQSYILTHFFPFSVFPLFLFPIAICLSPYFTPMPNNFFNKIFIQIKETICFKQDIYTRPFIKVFNSEKFLAPLLQLNGQYFK